MATKKPASKRTDKDGNSGFGKTSKAPYRTARNGSTGFGMTKTARVYLEDVGTTAKSKKGSKKPPSKRR